MQSGIDSLFRFDEESKEWLSNSIYHEDLPEYDWQDKKPAMKKVIYVTGKGFIVED